MRGKFLNYGIVNRHAPTETTDNEEKNRFFFETLEKAYDINPRNDIKIVLADFDAQVGKKSVNFPTTGKYSLHNLMNDNGSWLIQFAVSLNKIIGSSFYPHKNIDNCTWRSPDGVRFNQIDHLLIDRRRKRNLMDVRSYRGANIDSDHYLVIAHLRVRISNVNKATGTRTSMYDVSKMISFEVAEQSRQQTEEELNCITLTEQDNGEKMWER